MTQVAVVGAGLIGRAWSIVFARAGFDVALWDPYPQQVENALAFMDGKPVRVTNPEALRPV